MPVIMPENHFFFRYWVGAKNKIFGPAGQKVKKIKIGPVGQKVAKTAVRRKIESCM